MLFQDKILAQYVVRIFGNMASFQWRSLVILASFCM